MNSDEFLNQLADALMRGIERYFAKTRLWHATACVAETRLCRGYACVADRFLRRAFQAPHKTTMPGIRIIDQIILSRCSFTQGMLPKK